jgi:carboxylesterase
MILALEIIVLATVSIFFSINVMMLAWAVYEFIFLPGNKGGWSSSKILYPEKHNGKPTLIMVHGFTGNPFDFKTLSTICRKEGFRVLVPEVPGQGNRYFSFLRGRFKAEDYIRWLEHIILEETRLSGCKPWLIGLSMGGTLATIASSKGLVDRMVLISPFYGLTGYESFPKTRFFKWLIPVVPKMKKGKINDMAGYRNYIAGSMLVSLHAFVQLERLVEIAVEELDHITVPGLVICSRNDSVASFKRTRNLLSGRYNIDIREYKNGDHILLFDFDRDVIISDIIQFLNAA